jgi:hypothetical protein
VRLIAETDMRRRFKRVEMFLDYLEEQEASELKEGGLPTGSGSFYGPFIPKIRQQYEKERRFIKERFSRAGHSL